MEKQWRNYNRALKGEFPRHSTGKAFNWHSPMPGRVLDPTDALQLVVARVGVPDLNLLGGRVEHRLGNVVRSVGQIVEHNF